MMTDGYGRERQKNEELGIGTCMGPHIRGSQATNGPRMGWVADMGMNDVFAWELRLMSKEEKWV